MPDHLPPLASREVRSRVAVPVQPPVLKPSLIPFDVMQEMERETRVLPESLDDTYKRVKEAFKK